MCCGSRGHKVSDTTEGLNNSNMRTGVGLTCAPVHINRLVEQLQANNKYLLNECLSADKLKLSSLLH